MAFASRTKDRGLAQRTRTLEGDLRDIEEQLVALQRRYEETVKRHEPRLHVVLHQTLLGESCSLDHAHYLPP